MQSSFYTFNEMRADLVRRRSRTNDVPDALEIMVDQMIAVIDAMSASERELSNVIEFSPLRQQELASLAGVSLTSVRGLLGGRRSVEFVKRRLPGWSGLTQIRSDLPNS